MANFRDVTPNTNSSPSSSQESSKEPGKEDRHQIHFRTLNLRAWLMASRPKTLTAAIVPIVATSALAYLMKGQFSSWILFLCLVSSICIQIGTNFVNDAVDFKKGADTEKRIGPQRVTQSGIFSYRQVMGAAGVMFFLAIMCGIPLVIHGGWPIVLIGLLSVAMGYSYTSGPFPLAYLGLGDLFVVLFFGLIAVGGVYYLQTGEWSLAAGVLGIQIGFLSTVLIAINNLRDVDGDKTVNKKTLAVRFGKKFVKGEIAFLLVSPFVLGIYWWISADHFFAMLLPLFVFPLAIKLIINIFKNEPGPVYNKFLGMSALVHILFGVLFTVGSFFKI